MYYLLELFQVLASMVRLRNASNRAALCFSSFAPPLVNDLTQLAPGFGYWVRVNEDHTWIVDYSAP